MKCAGGFAERKSIVTGRTDGHRAVHPAVKKLMLQELSAAGQRERSTVNWLVNVSCVTINTKTTSQREVSRDCQSSVISGNTSLGRKAFVGQMSGV